MLLPNLQGIRVFADRYRGALLAVGIALLGLWQTALAFFASTLARASEGVLTAGVFALWPMLILGAYLWWRLLLRRTRPIEDYFDLALRTKGGKGPSRDDPKAVAAFIAGMGSMLNAAFEEKTEFFMLDDLDPQKLYNSARNLEIAAWKLANARDAGGALLLLSNETGQGAPVSASATYRQSGPVP